MPSYHRTQVLLKQRHYESLKQLAREEGLSLSALLRQILDEYLKVPQGERTGAGLQELAGIGRDPCLAGRNHDQSLYGQRA